MRILSLVLACAIGLIAAPAVAIDLFESEDGQTRFAFTGYAQPYYRLVDNPCSYSNEGECTRSTVGDGFGLTRARIAFEGQHGRSDFKVEIRTIPNVELLELRLRFDITDGFLVTAGRFRVPFSRQELTSESRLQLIDRAALIKGTPGRQLGLGITLSSDVLRSTRLPDDLIRLDAGVFNASPPRSGRRSTTSMRTSSMPRGWRSIRSAASRSPRPTSATRTSATGRCSALRAARPGSAVAKATATTGSRTSVQTSASAGTASRSIPSTSATR